MTIPDPSAEDEAIRAALPRGRASEAHDTAILAAADRVGAQIRARRRLRGWLAPLAVAASLVLVSVWMLFPNRSTVLPDDTLRGNGPALEISPANGSILARAPAKLEWSAVAGASTYEVMLRDAQGTVLGTLSASGSTQVALTLPAIHFVPGTYFWVVRARGPALDTQLGPFSFRIDAGT